LIINFTLFAFAISLGSFLGTTLNRDCKTLDLRQKLTKPSSCDQCLRHLSWFEIIPLISFIVLGGKCYTCRSKIIREYFFIELLMGLLSLEVMLFSVSFYEKVLLIIIFAFLLFQILLDYKEMMLSSHASLAILVLGLLMNLIFQTFNHPIESVLSASIGFLLLYSINYIYRSFAHKSGMGDGDYIFFASISCVAGYFTIPLILCLGSAITIFIGMIHGNLSKEMPFGTGLGIAFIILVPFLI